MRNLAVNERSCLRKRAALIFFCSPFSNLVKDKTKSKSIQKQNMFLIEDAKVSPVLHLMEVVIIIEAHCNVSLIDLSIFKIGFTT